MIEKKIFFSWQSDLNHDFNWKLIENCLHNSISDLNNKSDHVNFSLDLATRELPGSPDIVDSIFKKIENSSIFIADITSIAKIGQKAIPNPNVLIELGFAVNVIGWSNIICINNKSYGKVEHLPFDIKQRRITTYELSNIKDIEKQTNKLTEIFNIAIPLIQENQSDYDEITQIFKLQLDHILLSLANHFNLIFEIKESTIGIDVFYDVVDLLAQGVSTDKEIIIANTDDFLNGKISELKEVTKHPLLILNKKVNKITSIIRLIEALHLLRENILTDRFYDRNMRSGKSKLREAEILNLLLSDIAKAIENILANWGNHILTNPALLY